jgi:hypothetical protein
LQQSVIERVKRVSQLGYTYKHNRTGKQFWLLSVYMQEPAFPDYLQYSRQFVEEIMGQTTLYPKPIALLLDTPANPQHI